MTPVSSGPVYTTTKMARLQAMCVQMPGGAPLFYKATVHCQLGIATGMHTTKFSVVTPETRPALQIQQKYLFN